MRWARYLSNDGPRHAIVEDDRLIDVDGGPFTEHNKTGKVLLLTEVKLLPPFKAGNFYAVGFNYLGHSEAVRRDHSIRGRTCGRHRLDSEASERAGRAVMCARLYHR